MGMDNEIIVEDMPTRDRHDSPASTQKTEPVQHLALARRFDIDIPNKTEDGKLKEIWNYGYRMSTSKEIPDIVWQVISMEQALGTPRAGESRLDRLYRYAKLKRQEAQIQEELKGVSLGANL